MTRHLTLSQEKKEEKFSINQIFQMSASENDFIHTEKIYVDIAEDRLSGDVLARLIYWFSQSKKNEQAEAKVKFGDYLWVIKRDEDW